MATKKTSKSNVIDDNTQTLQTFDLLDLQQYTKEKAFSNNASKDFHLFFVGRDDVHDILKHVLSRVSVSLYMNMFGYDDDELNDIVMNLIMDKSVTVMITLDQSQSSGKHEKALLDADRKKSLTRFNSYVTVGESATRQISHTKGFVADGKVGGEGSTNWSNSGEGTFVLNGAFGGPGYKAQNNTQTIFIDPDSVSRFQTELITEHLSAHNPQSNGATKAAPAKITPKARAKQSDALGLR
jgi:hypothetical protein